MILWQAESYCPRPHLLQMVVPGLVILRMGRLQADRWKAMAILLARWAVAVAARAARLLGEAVSLEPPRSGDSEMRIAFRAAPQPR